MISGRGVAALLAWGLLVWLLAVSLAEMTGLWWLALIFGVALPVILLAQQNRRPQRTPERHAAGEGEQEESVPAGGESDGEPRSARTATIAPGKEPPLLEDPLTERELEVLNLMASGLTGREIAGELFAGVGTVKSHTASIYRKLGTRNRTEALARARSLGLLT